MSHSPDCLKRIPYRFLKNDIIRVSSAPGSSSTTSQPSLLTPRDEQGATTPQSSTPLPPFHARSGSDKPRQVARPGRTSSRLHDVSQARLLEHTNSLRKESQQKNGTQAAKPLPGNSSGGRVPTLVQIPDASVLSLVQGPPRACRTCAHRSTTKRL